MCDTCGCGSDAVRVTSMIGSPHKHPSGQREDAPTGPSQAHVHPSRTHTLKLEVDVLTRNDDLAAQTRAWLVERNVCAVNMMSSPGAGKTTLLERTIAGLEEPVAVIEGDQETLLDAERIRVAGARAVQVNTGTGCHLDARMVQEALEELQPDRDSLLFVENVGNLVCPALFDLGEDRKVVVISVTEGDDKPLKYPQMFAAADLVLVNKVDLLPYVDFDLERLHDGARRLHGDVEVLSLSARTGQGLEAWIAWLRML